MDYQSFIQFVITQLNLQQKYTELMTFPEPQFAVTSYVESLQKQDIVHKMFLTILGKIDSSSEEVNSLLHLLKGQLGAVALVSDEVMSTLKEPVPHVQVIESMIKLAFSVDRTRKISKKEHGIGPAKIHHVIMQLCRMKGVEVPQRKDVSDYLKTKYTPNRYGVYPLVLKEQFNNLQNTF